MRGRRDALAAKVLFSALKQLAQADGTLDLKTLRARVESNTPLDPWEGTILPHGKTRWCSALERYSHEYVKAGLILKQRGRWTLTDKGRSALNGDQHTAFDIARGAYESWEDANRLR
jgi:hypothetical protein